MAEMHGGSGKNGGFDPSKLHLKKEFTEIRKASKVLKDPGTSSTWRSPLSSGRALSLVPNANNHYYHHYMTSSNGNVINGDGNSDGVLLEVGNDDGRSGRGKEKGVFLYNWKGRKSESEKSVQVKDQGSGYRGSGELSASVDESEDASMSDARNGGGGDSRSGGYIGNKYSSVLYKYKNMNSGKRNVVKKRVMKNAHSAALWKRNQQQIVLRKSSKAGEGHVPLNLRRYDSVRFVDQSDDTSEYFNSEDLGRYEAESPLLAQHKSMKLSRGSGKEESSYSYGTPAMSTSSLRLYGIKDSSTVRSSNATTKSYNDGDDEVDNHLDLAGQQGCGMPCYWSRRSTPEQRGACRSYSPSLSDILRAKGSGILCGSQSMYDRRSPGFSLNSRKKRVGSRTAQGLIPFIGSSVEGIGGSSLGNSNDELSTICGELELEALNHLDGRRWSAICRSQEGLELVAVNEESESQSTPENLTSLSQKHRPVFFEELIGQNIVVQSLMNAILRGRIGPIYLFQGPRGTGKTSTARIFSAALNCFAKDETKPCGVCRSCADFLSGKSKDLMEVNGSNKKGIEKVRDLLETLSAGPSSTVSLHKVFVIDECHLLPAKTWLTFLKFLEQPPPRVVFIFITADIDNVPRAILSRCQKYLFNKIRDVDIVSRLRKITGEEELDVESDALDLIAMNADGSLRDAETMLDQLSLLGKRITTSLVNDLAGVVSDEKLLELLELAMSSDTAETVKRARELMNSGNDPMLLMSQMAALIMDIIAGTYHIVDAKYSDSIDGRRLNEAELERLKHALKLLSEDQKHLRVSSGRSTWFISTLLQLGSVPSPVPTQTGRTRRRSSRTIEDPLSPCNDVISQILRPDTQYTSQRSASPMSLCKGAYRNSTSQVDVLDPNSKPTLGQFMNGNSLSVSHWNLVDETTRSNMLDDIWIRCIERCYSKTLRQLLHNYGKLLLISEVEGGFVAYIAFSNNNIKLRAERFISSITNSFEVVLRSSNVEVRIVLLPDDDPFINSKGQVVMVDPMVKEHETQVPQKISRASFNDFSVKLPGNFQSTSKSLSLLVSENAVVNGTKETKPEVPAPRIESSIHEQRLETAYLQTAEKVTPGSNHLKPERNQVLPQDYVYHQNQMYFTNPTSLTSQHSEDELKDEFSALEIYDVREANQIIQSGPKFDLYPMSPNLLHNRSYAGDLRKESTGYKSSSGAGRCSGLCCWNNHKHRTKGKINQRKRAPVRKHKGGHFLWLDCARSTKTEEKIRKI